MLYSYAKCTEFMFSFSELKSVDHKIRRQNTTITAHPGLMVNQVKIRTASSQLSTFAL